MVLDIALGIILAFTMIVCACIIVSAATDIATWARDKLQDRRRIYRRRKND